jgi:hypothetical protein
MSEYRTVFDSGENLQDLKVCQICNLIWQHTSQFIIVKVPVEHNVDVT